MAWLQLRLIDHFWSPAEPQRVSNASSSGLPSTTTAGCPLSILCIACQPNPNSSRCSGQVCTASALLLRLMLTLQ
jgi:hypothetical protein